MAVPWTGFPMKAFLDLANPLGSAKYVTMQTFQDRAVAPGQRQVWYPWPYTEGLPAPQAANDPPPLATGGQPTPRPPHVRRRPRRPGRGRLRQPARQPVRRPLARRRAGEVRLQVGEVARPLHLRR